MVARGTPARFLFGSDSARFSDGFVVALLVATTAALAALVAATMTGLDVTGPIPIEVLVTAVAVLAALGGLLYGALGAGVLSGVAIAVAPYLGLFALAFLEETYPYPVETAPADVQFFAVVGVGLTVIGTAFHELPRVLDDEAEASDTSDELDQ